MSPVVSVEPAAALAAATAVNTAFSPENVSILVVSVLNDLPLKLEYI